MCKQFFLMFSTSGDIVHNISGVRCSNAVMTLFPGFKLRVGQCSGREQENSERHNPRREHASRTRQVQDPQTDPVREHQTAHR